VAVRNRRGIPDSGRAPGASVAKPPPRPIQTGILAHLAAYQAEHVAVVSPLVV
jgi:hypothetical protein